MSFYINLYSLPLVLSSSCLWKALTRVYFFLTLSYQLFIHTNEVLPESFFLQAEQPLRSELLVCPTIIFMTLC